MLIRWIRFIKGLRGRFVIGITSCPVRRSYSKLFGGEETFRSEFKRGNMIVLWKFKTAEAAAIAEAALIHAAWDVRNCRNHKYNRGELRDDTRYLYVVVQWGNV